MKEKDFQTVFGHWIRANGIAEGFLNGCAFELKLAHPSDPAGRTGTLKRSGYLRLDAVEPHQVRALTQVRREADGSGGSGLYYKLGDMSVGAKPFDCFFMAGCAAYVVVGWPIGVATATKRVATRVQALFVAIDDFQRMSAVIRERGASSVSLEELREYSDKVVVM